MRLPGLRFALGLTVAYVAVIVLLPLSALLALAASRGWPAFWSTVTAPRVLASYRLSLLASFAAATLDAIGGLVLAWAVVRHRFPGRRLIDAIIEIPLALPTAVAGIALTALYAQSGSLGGPLARLGVQAAYTPLGIVIALTFVGLPLAVRTVQPVIAELDLDLEDAAATLGASWWTTFRRIVWPTITPALISGFALAFARALGEYGSVVFIAGNVPMRTEIPPLLIMTKLDQFDYHGAAAIATFTLAISMASLLLMDALRWRVSQGAR
jgi:sulfate transport system permease protein